MIGVRSPRIPGRIARRGVAGDGRSNYGGLLANLDGCCGASRCTLLDTPFAVCRQHSKSYRRGDGQVACAPQFQTLRRSHLNSRTVDMDAKAFGGDADLVTAKHDDRLAERQLKMPLHSGERHLALRAFAEEHESAIQRHPDFGQGSFIQTPENLTCRRKTETRGAPSHRNTAQVRIRVARIIKFLKAKFDRLGR